MLDCVVAEDESLLRQSLLAMLATHADAINVVAECEDGGAALEAIAEHKPAVAFLDIHMPGLTGLEVAAAAVEASPGTQVVFVTAYDQYAIDAFEHGAVDYLLKPVAADRLAATVQRLQARAAAGAADPAAFQALLKQLTSSTVAPVTLQGVASAHAPASRTVESVTPAPPEPPDEPCPGTNVNLTFFPVAVWPAPALSFHSTV